MTRFFVRWFVALLMLPGFAQAQAVAATAMQRSVAGAVETNLARRGFASNDPRWGGTLLAAGASIAGYAAGAAVVTAAAVTAPAWVTAASTMTLATAFSAGLFLAADATVKWIMNSDGSITVTPSSSPGSSPNQGDLVWCSWNNTGFCTAANSGSYATGLDGPITASAFVSLWFSNKFPGNPNNLTPALGVCSTSGNIMNCNISLSWPNGDVNPHYSNFGLMHAPLQWSGYSCSGTMVNGTCQAGSPSPVAMSATAAVAALSSGDSSKPVNPVIIAAIADAAIKQAALNSPSMTFPYDPAQPVSAADASAWQGFNSSSWPKVGDLVAPQPAPSGGSAADPFTLPSSAAAPAVNPGTTPAQPTPASGIDWAIPSTGEQVPKTAVPVTFTPTVFAAPTGCPASITFSMFDKPYFISYQPACDLMSTLAPIFLACGAAAAALIFAEALKS